MRLSMIGAVAGAALLGATSPGIAQGPEPRGNDAGTARPQAQPQAPSQPRMERAPESRPQARPERNAEPQARPERNEPRAERPRQDEPKRAQRREDNTPPKETNKSTRTEQPNTEPKSEPRKSTEGRDRDKDVGKDQGKDQRKTTREQTPEPKGQPGRKDAGKQPDGRQPGQQPVRQVQANDDQRRGVRERLFRDRKPERVNLGVRVSIGTHIPRRHRLHVLPVDIVSYAPIYRGYSYILVDDEICIVDPQTYVVVDVIPASSTQRADRGARQTLALSGEQMRFVYANVDRDRRVDLRIRLALGAEIPRDVQLQWFDEPVLANVPELEPYRYVVVDNDVVIVNPDDYAIALVVNE